MCLAASLTLEGLEIETFGQPKRSSMFDLSLYLFEGGDALTGAVEYSTDLFDRETVERLMTRFVAVCQSVASDPDTKVSEVSHGFDEWGAAVVGPGLLSWAGGGGFVSVVERWWGAGCGDGGGAALVWERGWLSFGEVLGRVDAVAGVLAGAGVGRGDRVGVVAGRGAGVVVAVWGVWRCGAVLVPVDPGWPAARVAAVLADAGVGVVVGCGESVAGVEPGVVLDGQGRVAAGPGAAAGAGAAAGGGGWGWPGPGDEAYVLFTSGSTGRPKGVVVDHGALAALADGLAGVVPPASRGRLRVAVNAGLAFDACLQQLVQWAAGHCLVPVPAAVRQDPARLVRYVRDLRVDVLDGTPTQVRQLAAAGLLAGPGGPRLLLVGGEPLDPALWRQLARSPVRAVNMYGLAECAVDSTAAPVRPGTRPSIGTPLPGVRAYVLDAAGRPAGPDTAGQLWLAGPGLARGYLADPALTADRFRPDPVRRPARRPHVRHRRPGPPPPRRHPGLPRPRRPAGQDPRPAPRARRGRGHPAHPPRRHRRRRHHPPRPPRPPPPHRLRRHPRPPHHPPHQRTAAAMPRAASGRRGARSGHHIAADSADFQRQDRSCGSFPAGRPGARPGAGAEEDDAAGR